MGAAPPFVGVAVNVVEVPAQIVIPGFAAILTLVATVAVTEKLNELLVYKLLKGTTQVTPPTLNTQLTTSPFARLLRVNEVTVLPLAVAAIVAPDNAETGLILIINCVALMILVILVSG